MPAPLFIVFGSSAGTLDAILHVPPRNTYASHPTHLHRNCCWDSWNNHFSLSPYLALPLFVHFSHLVQVHSVQFLCMHLSTCPSMMPLTYITTTFTIHLQFLISHGICWRVCSNTLYFFHFSLYHM